LFNTSPDIKQISQQDRVSLRHVDSFTSITSEKVSLMSGADQSSVIQPLLTDLYQISMAYAYWKSGKHRDYAVFDLYFRKNRMLTMIMCFFLFKIFFSIKIVAFGGEYTLFAGLEECLKFVRDYKFDPSDIDYLRRSLPDYIENGYFDYLSNLDMNDIKIYAVPEGKIFSLNNRDLFLILRYGCFSSYTINAN
jgi:nicotinate phosphoribosyltransferase